MRIPSTLSLAVVAATMLAAATAGGSLATAATAATSPVEQSASQTFCADVNHERGARGLGALRCTYNGAAQSAVESHQDRTAVWIPLTSNPASATIAFMQSAPHRTWIMNASATIMDVGVSCASYQVGDGSTGFGMYLGANLPDALLPGAGAPIPPASPIVTASDNSSPCGVRTPPATIPPQPPATAPPHPEPPAPGTSNGSGPGSQPAPAGSTTGHGGTSLKPASPSTTILGRPKDSATGPGMTATTASGPHHKALVAKSHHRKDGPSSGAPHGSITSSKSSSPGGNSSWWWALVPVGGLALAAGLRAAQRIHSRTT